MNKTWWVHSRYFLFVDVGVSLSLLIDLLSDLKCFPSTGHSERRDSDHRKKESRLFL